MKRACPRALPPLPNSAVCDTIRQMTYNKKKTNFKKRGAVPRADMDSALARNPEGVLSVARSGTGFVKANDGGPDIMVPENDVGQALPGDRVEVALAPQKTGDARRSGRIVRVVERSGNEIVCTLRRNGQYLTAVPLLPNHKHTFNIARADGADEGDRVLVKMISWENRFLNPEGEISAIIGPADNPSLDTQAVAAAWRLPGEFPSGVLADAEAVSARLHEPGGREDLRALEIITIDPATARDFDDALSLEIDAAGNRVLGVHIADVSHFVEPGSRIDREALERGTSVYLPDKVIPMLPEQLSNGVCSLAPNEDRLAFSAFLTFGASGKMIARRFARSIIRSKLRLTYEQAQEVIDASEDSTPTAAAPATIAPAPAPDAGCLALAQRLVPALHRLSQQMRQNRFKRFALNLSAPEMEIVLDAKGMMTDVRPAVHSTSHELVEEAMVAANEAVAAEISSRRIPYISRSHEAPDPEKLAELSASVAALGLFPGDLTQVGNLARLIKAVAGSPLETYVSGLVLRSMKRAEYAVGKEGHFGLAKHFYSHFTSPIRRYPDLVLHRQLAAVLLGDSSQQPSGDALARIAAAATELENRAEQAERDLIEIKKYRFLEQQLADGKPLEYEAVAVKAASFGVFVDVPNLQIGGMIHISTLSTQFVRYDSGAERLHTSEFSIKAGDKLRVLVARVNFDERKLDFTATRLPPPLSGGEPLAPALIGKGRHAGKPVGFGRHGKFGKAQNAEKSGKFGKAPDAGKSGKFGKAPDAEKSGKADKFGKAQKAGKPGKFGKASDRKTSGDNYFAKPKPGSRKK